MTVVEFDFTAYDKQQAERRSKTKKIESADGAPILAPESAAYSGLLGDVVRAYESYTEADPAGLLTNLLVMVGAMAAAGPHMRVGEATHPPTLYAALVGRSSRARKDTAYREAAGFVERIDPGWIEEHRVSGFGSGEAFIDRAVEAKGLPIFLHESELSRPLSVAGREGDTSSTVLRSAWDYSPLELRTRKSGTLVAPATPVAMLGHITADELKDPRHGLRQRDVHNGFANRTLWLHVERRGVVPDPQSPPDDDLLRLARRLGTKLSVAQTVEQFRRTRDADDLWDDLYERIAQDDPPGIVGALTARAEAQVLRLSLIYAIADGAGQVDVPHLQAAWEVWRYARWSAQHIFVGDGTGDAAVDRVRAVLDNGEDLTGSQLDRMFSGHAPPGLRDLVVELGYAVEKEVATQGRPRKVLRAPATPPPGTAAAAWWTEIVFRRDGDR